MSETKQNYDGKPSQALRSNRSLSEIMGSRC